MKNQEQIVPPLSLHSNFFSIGSGDGGGGNSVPNIGFTDPNETNFSDRVKLGIARASFR